MLNRRTFLQNTLISGLGVTITNGATFASNDGYTELSTPIIQGTGMLINNERYWKQIRSLYDIPKDFINLENGYFSPQPAKILAFHQKKENYINTRTSWYMRREQEQAIEGSREALSSFLGCNLKELALTRNTTEAMNILITGYPWKKGDEVIIGNQDYGSMVSAFYQASKRFGIVIKVAEVPLHPNSKEETINAYTRLFSNQTRMVHVTHLINLTGQVIPVREIAEIATKRGIEVSVDSAHSVAHIKFDIPDLQADYVSASLHKWLCNPIGAGFLWMKAEHIAKIYPLMADEEYPVDDIRKFEHQGTRPIHTLETLSESIKFHQSIGSDVKQDRLRFLMRYWVTQVADTKKIIINTPFKNEAECSAIANVAIEGYAPEALAARLLNDYKIFTVAIIHPVVNGVRITPHIFTSLAELDILVSALKAIAG